ncbi:L,D-transpeptidase Cds6 family protein [Thiomicrospira pelophila]|uniref:L,D-transpeptidase Cds6 family protein n=1 Tax=Thiomicrospira pelophila TaxID=934 RepID=UPI0004A71C2E|nr:tetratricopeptide repeat protein [Thiomicrospira pelophila]
MLKKVVQPKSIKWPVGLALMAVLSLALANLDADSGAGSVDPALEVQQAIDDEQFELAKNLLDKAELSKFQRGYLQGWLSLKQQDSKAALETWQALRLQFPNSLELGNNVAVLLMQQGEYQQAQTILEQSLHANKQVSKALGNLNQLYAFQAQKAYKQVFSRLDVVAPKGQWLALTEASDVKVVNSDFAEQQQVTQAVEAWRQAWSSKNVTDYLASYSDNFVPANSQSLKAWRNARERSVTGPRFIEVYVSDVKLTPLSETLVRFTFNQRYRSNIVQDEVIKVLLLEKTAGQWKIVQEVVTNEIR